MARSLSKIRLFLILFFPITQMCAAATLPVFSQGHSEPPQNQSASRTSAAENSETAAPRQRTMIVTVTDAKGRFIAGLQRDSFTIYENKRPLEKVSFSDADEPADVSIMLDASASMFNIYKPGAGTPSVAAAGVAGFLQNNHPSNVYSVVAFNQSSQLLQDTTTDGKAVLGAVDKLAAIEPKGQTALYDACYLNIVRVASNPHRRHVLLLVSDGMDTSSSYKMNDLLRLLKESDVLVYGIQVLREELKGHGPPTQDQIFFEEITATTGGRHFVVTNDRQFFAALNRIALELRHQYLLGLTPPSMRSGDGWHPLKVEVTLPPTVKKEIKHFKVRSRRGYLDEASRR